MHRFRSILVAPARLLGRVLPRSLQTRLLLLIALAFVGFALLTDSYVTDRLKQTYDRSAEVTLSSIAIAFSDDFEAAQLDDVTALEERLERLARMEPSLRELSISVPDGDGRLLVSTADGSANAPPGGADLASIRSGEPVYRDVEEGGLHLADLSYPLGEPGAQPVASLSLSYDLDEFDAALADDRRSIALWTGGALLGFGLLMLVTLRYAVMRPLRRLAGAAGRIAEGEPGVRLAWTRRDEIGHLANEFDRMAADLELTHGQLSALASIDPLTGLLNHRCFHERLEEELARAGRESAELSLLAIDVDDFKGLNDRLGHLAGDQALRDVAASIKEELRPADVCGRLGGDEFAVALPRSDESEARLVAERLRERVACTVLSTDVTTTVSIGVATFPRHAGRVDGLLALADAAMYASKRGGRDQVSVCEVPAPVPAAPPVADSVPPPASASSPPAASAPAQVEPDPGTRRTPQEVHALAAEADARDGYTHEHALRVAAYAEAIARSIGGFGPAGIDALRQAAILHDVGKIGISDAILSKPGSLSPAEYAEMKRHSELGAEIISGAGLDEEATWVRHLHERWDGHGYPVGLEGEQIPLESRILHAADMLEAMTSSRVYREALPQEFALIEIEAGAGSQLDPRIAGTLAELLRSGRLDVDPLGVNGDASDAADSSSATRDGDEGVPVSGAGNLA